MIALPMAAALTFAALFLTGGYSPPPAEVTAPAPPAPEVPITAPATVMRYDSPAVATVPAPVVKAPAAPAPAAPVASAPPALPPCAEEEAAGPACYWDARNRGNRRGNSFIWTGSQIVYTK